MATKKTSLESRIILPAVAVEKIARLISRPQSAVQKRTLIQARGVYSLYQAKWQKTK